MTLEPLPSVNAPINVYGGNVTLPPEQAQAQPKFRRRQLPRKWDGRVMAWEWTVDRLDGGLSQRGPFEQAYDKLGNNSAFTFAPRVHDGRLTPHLLTSTKGLGANTHQALFWTRYGPTRTLVMGGGSSANTSLTIETSATDSTPAHVTYSPVTAICSLSAAPIGGATNPERIIIGMTGTAPDVHSAPGTSLGSMHANLNPLWGVIVSPLNATTPGTRTLLCYANGGIWTLPITAALGGAPTQAESNWANGGSAIGYETLSKAQWGSAAYWLRPLQNRTTSAYTGSPDAMEVVRTNLEGTDSQIISFNLLSHVWWTTFWNRNLCVADGTTLVRYDGEEEEDLKVLDGLAMDSTYTWRIIGVANAWGQLLCRVQSTSTAATAGGMVLVYMGKRNGSHVWLPAVGGTGWSSNSGSGSAGSASANGIPFHDRRYGVSMPFSVQTGYLHEGTRDSTNWNRSFIVPPGIDAFNFYRQNQAAAGLSLSWEQDFVARSAALSLPGELGDYPSVLECIDHSRANYAAGPATFTCDIHFDPVENEDTQVTGGTATAGSHYWAGFNASGAARNRRQYFPVAGSAFYLFKYTVRYSTASSTNKTPDLLPITFRGLTFLDGVVRDPKEVWGSLWPENRRA